MPVFVGAGTSSFMKGSDGVGVSTMTTTERNALTGVKKGQFIFNETVNLAQYYDGTAWKSIDSPPSITNFTIDGGSSVTSAKVDRTAGGNSTIVIAGSNFDTTAGTVTFVPESGGATVNVQSIVRNSVNQFTVTVQRSDFIEANDPYTIRLANGSGLSASLAGAIDVNVPPVFAQSADTNLATIFNGGAALSGSTANASATDADGDTITYSILSGSLPSGLTLGSSTGYITGSVSGVAVQEYVFTVQAATSVSNSTRQFKITVSSYPQGGTQTTNGGYTYHTFTSSGIFQVYTGFAPNIEVFMMGAGGGGGSWVPGGGGAGGCVNLDSPASYTTSVQQYTVTVGAGGLGQLNPGGYSWQSAQQASITGGDTSIREAGGTYVLTAIGGGRGGSYNQGGSTGVQNGGCGGGKGISSGPNGSGVQTSATTSPLGTPVSANSRTYGIGYDGGSSSSNEGYGQQGGGGLNNSTRGSGNGKHGANFSWISFLNKGTNSSNNPNAGGYFGGGGGAGHHSGGGVGSGGQGGGAQGRSNSATKAQSGFTNTGGGGGGGGRPGGEPSEGGNGGSGIVIIRYTSP
tara:strand:- start:52 stop:1773 length:1722 start_codon:yes stop_codon:yes gene_type:complete